MMLSLGSFWYSKNIAYLFFSIAVIAAFFLKSISLPWAFVLLALPVFLFIIKSPHSKNSKFVAHLGFIALSFLLFFHKIPAFNNLKVFDAITLAPHCKPFTMYMNLEGSLVAFFLLAMYIPLAKTRTEWIKILKSSSLFITLCTSSLMVGALCLGQVTLNIKFPSQTLIFLSTNLMLVCIYEEAFFRGYLQKELTEKCHRYRVSPIYALIAASILFGLRHYHSGIPMIILSTIAGLFYGAAFLKTERIESSILVHFGLNAIHFFFFSYPALLR